MKTIHLLLALTLAAAVSRVAAVDWPLEISGPEGRAIVYQPQPESFKDDKITARVAVAAQPKGAKAPVFGAAWMEARVSTDRDTRTVTVLDVKIPKVKFPNATAEEEKKFGEFVANYLTQMNATFPMERLVTSLEAAEKENTNANNLKNDPPKIIFATEPTVLVTLDGEPQLRPIENSQVMRVVNTPFVIVFDRDSKSYYLRAGDAWLSATDMAGPWKKETNLPATVKAALPKELAEAPPSSAAEEPKILVTKEPAELVVSDGEINFTPLPDNEILYASNTDSDLFIEISSGNYFLLIAGRWYSAPAPEGPWTFVSADKLPGAFERIPPGSAKGNILAHVAGTTEAEDAVLDASVPQTKAIDRDAPVNLKVDYDGDPKFENVEGTSLDYGVNTSNQVIKSSGKYYCCEKAVWYQSDGAQGPWKVSDSVPKDVYTIPPSNPNYNVTYVRVYDSTPRVVYVGYLPGYVGSYVYGGTVVYGTGYVYRPWLGAFFYPRPLTWGFAVVYDPRYGSWGYPPVVGGWYGAALMASRAYWGGVYAGWWGPGGYRYYGNSYKVTYKYKYNYNYNGNKPPSYRPPNNGGNRPPGSGGGNRPSQLPAYADNRPGRGDGGGNGPGRDNIYNRPDTLPARPGTDRPGQSAGQLPANNVRPGGGASQLPADKVRPGAGASQLPAEKNRPGQGQVSTRPAKSPNDVFASRDGNVYRKSGNNWQENTGKGWSKPGGGKESPQFDRSRPQLERDSSARQRGSQQMQRPQSSQRGGGSRGGGGGGGGSRGGGGGRRR
jgi:hypothetical protein